MVWFGIQDSSFKAQNQDPGLNKKRSRMTPDFFSTSKIQKTMG